MSPAACSALRMTPPTPPPLRPQPMWNKPGSGRRRNRWRGGQSLRYWNDRLGALFCTGRAWAGCGAAISRRHEHAEDWRARPQKAAIWSVEDAGRPPIKEGPRLATRTLASLAGMDRCAMRQTRHAYKIPAPFRQSGPCASCGGHGAGLVRILRRRQRQPVKRAPLAGSALPRCRGPPWHHRRRHARPTSWPGSCMRGRAPHRVRPLRIGAAPAHAAWR